MNKYLMLTAAAFVGSLSPAHAAHQDGHGQVVLGFDGSCDTFTFTWKGNEYADVHSMAACGISSTIIGMGISTKTKGLGKHVMVADNYIGDVEAGYLVDCDFQLPFRTGNTMSCWYTKDGKSMTEFLTTTYTVEKPKAVHPKGNMSFRDLIRARIASREKE